ncbi:MAG: hypothetical protein L0229_01695 [Blastocatellia bacterium]|nr:hypothetical protein [Blastocatellia bacterium]
MTSWNDEPEKRELLSNPRPHHYVFAHQAVKGMVKGDPLQFFSIIASEGQRDFLDWIWDFVCEHLSGEDPGGLSASDINAATCSIKTYPAVIISMPEPRAIAEAHFIAIVLTGELSEAVASDQIEFRYFTLECGTHMDGTERTVMCEWSGDTHMNFGDGPEPDLRKFAEVVEKMI